MAALESSLARVLQDFQEDRRRLTAVFGAERAEAQADIRALRQLAKARGRALHKVRHLACGLAMVYASTVSKGITSITPARAALSPGEEAVIVHCSYPLPTRLLQ